MQVMGVEAEGPEVEWVILTAAQNRDADVVTGPDQDVADPQRFDGRRRRARHAQNHEACVTNCDNGARGDPRSTPTRPTAVRPAFCSLSYRSQSMLMMSWS